ncbi:MAG: NfeD family protein [Thermodesulfobacteriota bacterium]
MNGMLTPAMMWAILGAILFVVELSTFTFIFSFFGIGAFVTALLTWLGVTPTISAQLAAFSASSIITLVLFRKSAKRLLAGGSDLAPEFAGWKVKVTKDIPPGNEGAVDYRGSEWIAFSDSTETIAAGEQVEILGIEGTRLKVKK